MSCGAETEANALLASLTAGDDFTIPSIDVSGPEYQFPVDSPIAQPIARLTNDDLTQGTIGGNGTFDVLMRAFKEHLSVEHKANRITGSEYSKTYIALTESAMQQGVAFLLGRDQAYWQAITAQQQALLAQIQVTTARVQLAIAKVQMASLQLEALTNKANYALTKMKLSTESIQYCQAKFMLDYMLPQQLILLKEQSEAQRAQTSNTRSDGSQVLGTLGKQRDLYTQQITSYQRDGEVKAAKLFTDAWITQKTIDEGLLAPPNFQNASVDTVLGRIKANNGLG